MWGVIRQRAAIFGGVPVSPPLRGNAFSSSVPVGLSEINTAYPSRRKRKFSFRRSIFLNVFCVSCGNLTNEILDQRDMLRARYIWNKKQIAIEREFLACEESLHKNIFARRASQDEKALGEGKGGEA